MKRLIMGLCVLCFMAARAEAQTGSGYLVFAPGKTTFGLHDTNGSIYLGGGGKYLSSIGLGAGIELGMAGPAEEFYGEGTLYIFSANGYYAFKTISEKIQPFITSGYSRSIGQDNLFNFGGGVDCWFKDKLGMTLGFRGHIGSKHADPSRMWEFRIGVLFR